MLSRVISFFWCCQVADYYHAFQLSHFVSYLLNSWHKPSLLRFLVGDLLLYVDTWVTSDVDYN